MGRKAWLTFSDASIDSLQDLNASFATGRLRVMYTGANQNGSEFSREVVEAALPTLSNIPIVAHYDTESNEIGSHDVELVSDDGGLRFRNLTEPCGVVPESASRGFSTERDANGVQHDYLVVEPVILWKRQEVYRHISDDLDGRVDHSMEVSISAYHKDAGSDLLKVDEFSFEALCLLERARPCFEGSELELFSAGEFKSKMEEMMAELKETFSQINSPDAGIDIDTTKTEGGRVLDEKLALLAEYGLDAETLDFSLDDFSPEELREKFEAMKEAAAAPETDATFELSGNVRKALCDALGEKTVERPWGTEPAFWFEEFDPEAGMVYAQCTTSWNLFGFPYSMDGDMPVINFEAGKRMKRAFVEFDEGGEEDGTMAQRFEQIGAKYEENERQWSEKYEALERDFEELKESTADVEALREFKAQAEQEAAERAREEIFGRFEDLEGNEAFETLKEHAGDYEVSALEKECYAIRGMANVPAKFAAEDKAAKLKVVRDSEAENEPYGGLFRKYGPHRNS